MRMEQRERELWLLVIGAALASPEYRAEMSTRVPASSAPTPDLQEILSALECGDGAAARRWFIERLATPHGDEQRNAAISRVNDNKLIDCVDELLARLVVKRESAQSVFRVQLAQSLGAADFADFLRGEADRIEAVTGQA